MLVVMFRVKISYDCGLKMLIYSQTYGRDAPEMRWPRASNMLRALRSGLSVLEIHK